MNPASKAGGPIQSCRNFVDAFQDEFEISILTSDRDQGDSRPYPGITADSWITGRAGVPIYYAGPGSPDPERLQRIIKETGPDYIYLNSMYSYRFTILPLWLKWRGRLRQNIVLAPRGMLQEGAIQFKSLKKKLFIKVLNAAGLPRRLTFQATDEQEKMDIIRYFPSAGRVAVVSNVPKMQAPEWMPVTKRPGELNAVFISRLAPKKNLLFLLEALDNLPADIRLQIKLYGETEDEGYWKKCLAIIEKLPPNLSVHREGPIPNDMVTAVLQQHHVFVLPTLGENFGHAIFEAFLAGKPVLISNKTPWLQLEEQQVGFDLPLDPPAFADALKRLAAMDQDEYDKWSRNAFEYARKIKATDLLKEKYLDLFYSDRPL